VVLDHDSDRQSGRLIFSGSGSALLEVHSAQKDTFVTPTLALEVGALPGEKSAGLMRRVFDQQGGTIGRATESSLVLPNGKVSSRHAVISFRNGVFYIEDKSRNGISINSVDNRLAPGRPYALKNGDRIFIEPYEIRATIEEESTNSFPLDDPFVQPVTPQIEAAGFTPPAEASGGGELDPLKLLGASPRSAPPRKVPAARDLAQISLHEEHYQPPAIVSAPVPMSADAPLIPPQGYDPLAPEDSDITASLPAPAPVEPAPVFEVPSPPTPPPKARESSPSNAADPPRAVDRPRSVIHRATPPESAGTGTADLAEVLAGAGLVGAPVTPELARNFGQILRVVVSGVMDVLRARHEIKDEFGLDMTYVRPADNNPLKFSANVEDALHNLLVKRNAAYLPPVEAFADAFEDLRNHQIAMLAGMRVAFESMLGEFDPKHLQEEFDRQLGKGSLLSVPAKLRYWDLYCDRCHDIVKDPEASFRELFGEEFARAYEAQLKRLKVKSAREPEEDRR